MSSFGRILKISTFGESHGIGVGCIIEGLPPNLPLSKEDIQYQLNRRKPNQNSLLSPRNEPDIVEIYSGTQNEITLGTPICLIVKNIDMKSKDYKSFSNIPRPGHADFTYLAKYGVKASSGGGRSSARETVARVAAGAATEQFLKRAFNCDIISWVLSIGEIKIPNDFQNFLMKNLTKLKFEKSFLDEIGTFIIFSNDNSNTNSDNISWIVINKLTKRAFLFDLHENLIKDLENEFINEKYYEEISNDNTNNAGNIFDINNNIDFLFQKNLKKIIQLANIDKANSTNSKDFSDLNYLLSIKNSSDLNDLLLFSQKLFIENNKKIKNKIIFNSQNFEFKENINIRSPHVETSIKMIQMIHNTKMEKDSIGGIVSCVISNCPRSLGEPCFDKFEADLAKAMLSIPATKGFEIGSGFEGTKLK